MTMTATINSNINLQVILWAILGIFTFGRRDGMPVRRTPRTGDWGWQLVDELGGMALALGAATLAVVYWPVTLCVAGIVVFAWVTYPRGK